MAIDLIENSIQALQLPVYASLTKEVSRLHWSDIEINGVFLEEPVLLLKPEEAVNAAAYFPIALIWLDRSFPVPVYSSPIGRINSYFPNGIIIPREVEVADYYDRETILKITVSKKVADRTRDSIARNLNSQHLRLAKHRVPFHVAQADLYQIEHESIVMADLFYAYYFEGPKSHAERRSPKHFSFPRRFWGGK